VLAAVVPVVLELVAREQAVQVQVVGRDRRRQAAKVHHRNTPGCGPARCTPGPCTKANIGSILRCERSEGCQKLVALAPSHGLGGDAGASFFLKLILGAIKCEQKHSR